MNFIAIACIVIVQASFFKSKMFEKPNAIRYSAARLKGKSWQSCLLKACKQHDLSYAKYLLESFDYDPSFDNNEALKCCLTYHEFGILDLLLCNDRLHIDNDVNDLYLSAFIIGTARLFLDERTQPTAETLIKCYEDDNDYVVSVLLGHPDIDPHCLDAHLSEGPRNSSNCYRLLTSLMDIICRVRTGDDTVEIGEDLDYFNDRYIAIFGAALMNGHPQIFSRLKMSYDPYESHAVHLLAIKHDYGDIAADAYLENKSRYYTKHSIDFNTSLRLANQFHSGDVLRAFFGMLVTKENQDNVQDIIKAGSVQSEFAIVRKLFPEGPEAEKFVLRFLGMRVAESLLLDFTLPKDIVSLIIGYAGCNYHPQF